MRDTLPTIEELDAMIHDLESRIAKIKRLAVLRRELERLHHEPVMALVRPELSKAIDVVCEEFNITREHLYSRIRDEHHVWPRFVCYYVLREACDAPLMRIAESLRRDDHGAVLHGYHRVKERMSIDAAFTTQVEKVLKRLQPERKEELAA